MGKKKRGLKVKLSCIHKLMSNKIGKNRRSFRKIIRPLGSSIIQELSYEFNKNQHDAWNVITPSKRKTISERKRKRIEVEMGQGDGIKSDCQSELDKTIDLCADESSDCVVQLHFQPEKNSELLIDLSKDSGDDVIIMDENIRRPAGECKDSEVVVLDLDECKPGGENSKKINRDVNDDVLVIETFNQIPLSCSASNKIDNSFKYCMRLKKRGKHLKNGALNCDKGCNYERMHSYNPRSNPKNRIGANVYANSSFSLPKSGLRPIIIDGSNVAYGFHSDKQFSCKRLQICIQYFKERGHKVTAFVPQFRTLQSKCDNPGLLNKMADDGDVILTPSKRVEGKNIVPYDDRFIVQTAVLLGGIIVTRDNYRDLLIENPAWAETINYRTLPYTWVGDVLMFPKDPLGAHGPTLEEFLRFN